MNTTMAMKSKANPSVWTRPAFWTVMVVALPFLLGTILLAWSFLNMPETESRFARAQMLQALLFTFGLTFGLMGSAFSLATKSEQQRQLSNAAVLFGASHIMLAFTIRRFIDQHSLGLGPSLLPFVIPVGLWMISVVMAIRTPGIAENSPKESIEIPSAEQADVTESEDTLETTSGQQ